ncbi:MAG: hypothetical protein JNL88_01185 [Bacteroidia bacterium]|nr:hypothetical protein [Bacteroidia bacterium]
MDAVQLIITICLYIVSIVISLLLGMTSRRFNPESIRLPVAFHLILLFLALVFALIFQGHAISQYMILFSICSGLSLSGWALRNTYLKRPLKIYFGLFLFTVPLFLWSPSLLFYSISGNYGHYRPEQEFRLQSNYFLVEQQSMLHTGMEPVKYKVIRKYGIYNKTLARDLDFRKRLVAVELVRLSEDTLVLEGRLETGQSSRLGVKPGMKKNKITRKPVNS